jgi:predicted dehydrogenase
VGWEAFLRHVAAGAPLESDFAAGIRDVAFADACHRSMRERTWIALPAPGEEQAR